MPYPYDKLLDFQEAQDEVRLLGKDWEIATCEYARPSLAQFDKVFFWQLDFEHLAPYLGLKQVETASLGDKEEWKR